MIRNGYNTDLRKAVAGMQADSGNSYNESGKTAKGVIPFGMAVYKSGATEVQTLVPDTSVLAFDADFVALNVINLKVNGGAIAPVTFDTDHATTSGLIKDAILLLAGVTDVEVSVDGRDFTVTTAGIDCLITDVAVTLGASQAGSTVTPSTIATFRGISVQIHNEAGYYENEDTVTFKRQGRIWGQVSVEVDEDDAVYVDLSDQTKRFTNVSGGNTLVPTAVFRSDSEDGIAVIEINLP